MGGGVQTSPEPENLLLKNYVITESSIFSINLSKNREKFHFSIEVRQKFLKFSQNFSLPVVIFVQTRENLTLCFKAFLKYAKIMQFLQFY